MIIIIYRKQVIPNAIARHPLTKSRSVPEQQLPPASFPEVYIISTMSRGMEYPFAESQSAVLLAPPPSFLCTLHLLIDRRVV